MTSRIVKPQPEKTPGDLPMKISDWVKAGKEKIKRGLTLIHTKGEGKGLMFPESPYKIGNILYVRETMKWDDVWGWYYAASPGDSYSQETDPFHLLCPEIFRSADHFRYVPKRKVIPSIHMPKEAARIFLKVTDIDTRRLHNFKTDDIIKEGIRIPVNNGKVYWSIGEKDSPLSFMSDNQKDWNEEMIFKAHWASLWTRTNGKECWDQNPFVFSYTFEKTNPNL